MTPPARDTPAFTCPHCGVLAQQLWNIFGSWIGGGAQMTVSQCHSCYRYVLWNGDRILYPSGASPAPAPDPGLPDALRADYDEAADIVERSPRGACALLRLVIQRMAADLASTPGDLNSTIGTLVKQGLPAQVQQALDVVRVVGNNAVHPGELDLRDDRPTALALFKLVNMIADRMITQPKEIALLYESLPERALKAIEKRDA